MLDVGCGIPGILREDLTSLGDLLSLRSLRQAVAMAYCALTGLMINTFGHPGRCPGLYGVAPLGLK